MVLLLLTALSLTAPPNPFPGMPYRDVLLSGRCHRVYVTIDDHPNSYTPQVLRVLARRHVLATFFLTTWPLEAAANYPRQRAAQRLLRHAMAIKRAGHTVANHTHNHLYLCRLNHNGIYLQIYKAQYFIDYYLNVQPRYWRAPFLAYCKYAWTVARGMGLRHVTSHFDDISTSAAKMWLYTRIRARKHRYTVVLFHKFYWKLDRYLQRLNRAPKCKLNHANTGSTTTIVSP